MSIEDQTAAALNAGEVDPNAVAAIDPAWIDPPADRNQARRAAGLSEATNLTVEPTFAQAQMAFIRAQTLFIHDQSLTALAQAQENYIAAMMRQLQECGCILSLRLFGSFGQSEEDKHAKHQNDRGRKPGDGE